MIPSELDRPDLIRSVSCTDADLVVTLKDGRTVSAPLSWYPCSLRATPAQRAAFEIGRFGIPWGEIEDIELAGVLVGAKAPDAKAPVDAQRCGMASLADAEGRNQIADVRFDRERIYVRLRDGRAISIPLSWYPRLLNATPEQREQWQVTPFGDALHWEEIDEDLDVRGFLIGAKAPDAKASVEA